MKNPCFAAIAKECKKDKKCWENNKDKLQSCKKEDL